MVVDKTVGVSSSVGLSGLRSANEVNNTWWPWWAWCAVICPMEVAGITECRAAPTTPIVLKGRLSSISSLFVSMDRILIISTL